MPDTSIGKGKSKLYKEELKIWVHKDYVQDTIAGTSLDKAYR